MGSKPITFLFLSFAIFLIMIASEVAARDLAHTTASATSLADSAKEADEVKYANYPGEGKGGRGYGGGGRGGHPTRGGYGRYGGYCLYGCCRRSYLGRGCKMCCPYQGKVAMDAEPQVAKLSHE